MGWIGRKTEPRAWCFFLAAGSFVASLFFPVLRGHALDRSIAVYPGDVGVVWCCSVVAAIAAAVAALLCARPPGWVPAAIGLVLGLPSIVFSVGLSQIARSANRLAEVVTGEEVASVSAGASLLLVAAGGLSALVGAFGALKAWRSADAYVLDRRSNADRIAAVRLRVADNARRSATKLSHMRAPSEPADTATDSVQMLTGNRGLAETPPGRRDKRMS